MQVFAVSVQLGLHLICSLLFCAGMSFDCVLCVESPRSQMFPNLFPLTLAVFRPPTRVRFQGARLSYIAGIVTLPCPVTTR